MTILQSRYNKSSTYMYSKLFLKLGHATCIKANHLTDVVTVATDLKFIANLSDHFFESPSIIICCLFLACILLGQLITPVKYPNINWFFIHVHVQCFFFWFCKILFIIFKWDVGV